MYLLLFLAWPSRFVDLALAFSLGEGKRLAATCKFRLDDCSGSRRDFILGCFNAVAASTACRVTDRWFPPDDFLVHLEQK